MLLRRTETIMNLMKSLISLMDTTSRRSPYNNLQFCFTLKKKRSFLSSVSSIKHSFSGGRGEGGEKAKLPECTAAQDKYSYFN